MPIAYILGNLLAEVREAAGVVFLDEVGEAIETASSDLSLDEMRTTGAIAEIQLRRLREIVAPDVSLGVPDVASGVPDVPSGVPDVPSGGVLHVEGEGMHLHAVRLKDGFVVVLLQRLPSLSSTARLALQRAGRELEREILT